jgi:hypothetical protein
MLGAAVSAVSPARRGGLAGLVDRRLGKASMRRVPVDKLVWMLGEYRTHHLGWGRRWYFRQRGGRTPLQGSLRQGGAAVVTPQRTLLCEMTAKHTLFLQQKATREPQLSSG